MEVNRTRRGDEAIDLNAPPQGEQGSGLSFVLLTMDSKTICRTKVCDVLDPIEVYVDFNLFQLIMLAEYYSYTSLDQNYFWDGIVKYMSGTFYILAPKPHSFSHVVILYETGLKEPGVCKNMAGMSGISNGNEEICDNKPHPKLAVTKRTSSLTRNFVSTDPNYIRTLSQTHAGWIFGAIAELIDNSRDAGASRLDISIQYMFSKQAEKKVPVLCVVDNGHGMTFFAEMMRMVSFGHKRPDEHCKDQIGIFGIVFKTGAMKLGRDAVVLTQTSTSRPVFFLSQSFNENKAKLEVPLVTYCKKGQYIEIDSNTQSEVTAKYNLNAIKEFSPFNEYVIGEKVALFGEEGTGTQVYILNLDRWGTDYTLEWNSEKTNENSASHGNGDILICSKGVRSRPGQTTGNSYKLVGGQKHNTDMGRGIIGVADITDLIDDENGNNWVLNSKQGFQDCEI